MFNNIHDIIIKIGDNMKDKQKLVIFSILVYAVYYLIPKVFNLIDYSRLDRTTVIALIYVIDLIPLIFLILIYWKDLKKEFKPFKDNFLDYQDKYIRYYFVALILMTVSNILIERFTGSNISGNEEAIRNIGKVLPIYTIISCSFIAPVCEELIYRKTLKNIFINDKLSIIFSGLIFGIAHVISTYTNLIDLLYIIPYGIFGAMFMYIYCDSKNIWNTIFIHFLHNTLLLIAYYIR